MSADELLCRLESKSKKAKGDEDSSPQLRFSRYLSGEVESDDNVTDCDYGTRDGSVYLWSATHWKLVRDEDVERLAHGWLAKNTPAQCSERMSASCSATSKLHLKEIPKTRAGVIPLIAGSVTVDELGVCRRESGREDGLTYRIECEYDPLANREMFDSFLSEALPNSEVKDFLQEFAGYTLLPDTRHQLAAWLVGQGGTGKGTFAQIMQALHKQTIALSIDALDGFKLSGLQSASLVTVDETPQRIDEQRLKTLISGDSIQVDRKYRDPLTLRPTAKWIVNGNALPAISDHSSGFWRRWLIFPFNIVPSKKSPLLAESIIDRELSGVLNWCLDGLVRLLARGEFPTLPAEMIDAARQGKQQSNNVAGWLVDCGVETSDNNWLQRRTVYQLYAGWCAESGTKTVSSAKFFERLSAAMPDLREERTMVGGERRYRVNVFVPPQD